MRVVSPRSVLPILFVAILSGCALDFGDDRGVHVTPPTLARQMIELNQARDRGLISEEDYDTAMYLLLHEYDGPLPDYAHELRSVQSIEREWD